MKVTTKTDILKHLLRVANRTVGDTTDSITSHVMLTAGPNTLTAMTTDLVAGTSIVATAQVAEEGSICLPAKKLAEIVGKMPEYAEVSITADTERWKATIVCGTYRGTISGMDPVDMPRSPTMEDLDKEQSLVIKLQTKGLDRMIKQVSAFTQEKNVTDIKLSGVSVTFKGNAVTMMSCDGVRLCVRTIPVTGNLPEETLQLIMPKKQLNDFANLLDDADEAEIGVTPAQNKMIFRVPRRYSYSGIKHVEIASQLLAGPYPDLSRIVPTKSATRIVIQRAAFADALKLANVLADKYHHILLEVDPPEKDAKNGQLTISAKNPLDGDSEQTLSVNVQGRATEMWFNGEFLEQWLRLVDQETIILDLLSPKHPGLLYPHGVDAKGYFYVCLPMSMEEDEEGEPKPKKKGKAAAAPAAPAAQPAAADPTGSAHTAPQKLAYVPDDDEGYDPTYEYEDEVA